MQYRMECETIEGEMIVSDPVSFKQAKACARFMSKRHITAYAVAVEDGTPVGHVAYGCGRQSEILGRVR